MRYVDQVLQPGERIRRVTTISWAGFLRGLTALFAALVILLLTTPLSLPSLRLMGQLVALLLAIFGLYLLGQAWWRRFTTEVAVTDRRVIYAVGFVNRHTVEINMDKIESVDVEQGLLARLLNYGDIAIHGTGDTHEVLREIDHPLEFRSCVTAA